MLKNLDNLHNDLPFLLKRIKNEKFENFVANLHDKTGYVIHKKNLKQVLSYGLVLKKLHRIIRSKQKSWLKLHIDIKTNQRKKNKHWFWKMLFKLMSNSARTMENVIKQRDNKLVTTERRKSYLVSEPNYHTTKFFTENLLRIEMEKMQICINKPVYLELSILESSKILMYEFWYNYVKRKYHEKTKLCCMGKDSLTVHIKRDDIYENIAEDV